ncbi:hypothetical protein [Caballeronia sp. BCC1704]|uniref:hypothetical protein n=1 Tax=Caballeronia sp. BCC1704 TaxID=2676300 RepID=UPI001FC7CFB9|nr:hypothetical protein [Caballeronia sp. BCC1704]
MKELLNFALQNLILVVGPVVAFAVILVLLRVKNRYVNQGVLFRRMPPRQCEPPGAASEEEDVSSHSHIDLEIALRKFQELGLEDGDLGYAYWYEVAQLLKRAEGMQARIDALIKELEQCRARLGKRA